MPIRPKNHDVVEGGVLFGRLPGSDLDKPAYLDAADVLTILNAQSAAGSKWMDLDQIGTGTTGDRYPTDGRGGTGAGDLLNQSDLRLSESWIIDGVLARFNSSGFTLTLKDALGVTIGNPIDFITPMPQPHDIQLGIPLTVLGGFTGEITAPLGGSVSILYRDFDRP